MKAPTTYAEALPPRLEVIEALAAAGLPSRWCVWLAKPREGGKPAKVPMRLNGGRLESLKPNQSLAWGSFEEARVWLEASTEAKGLGVLMTGGGCVGVDFDNVLTDGGEIAEHVPGAVRRALEALKEDGVYLEVSPSGTGLRSFYKGCKPAGCGERKGLGEGVVVEMYDGDSTRYLTVSGHGWQGAPVGLVQDDGDLSQLLAELLGLVEDEGAGAGERSTEGGAPHRTLRRVSDEEVIAKIKQGGGTGRGKRLWEGDLSDYPGDHSAADAALCCLIARWTDDPAQIERIWAASGLGKREKFRKRKGYRDQTIANGLTKARESAAKGRKDKARKQAKTKAALESGGDTDGALAAYLEQHGGTLPRSLASADMVLTHDRRLAEVFAFDGFAGQVVKLRCMRSALGEVVPADAEPKPGQTWEDADTAAITVWLARVWGLDLPSKLVDEAVEVAARRRRFNSVTGALDALVWDGVKRLDSMLSDYYAADTARDDPAYLSAIGRAWMVGTVARAYLPGCKHDHVLTLQGPQGFGKSRAARALVETVAPHAYREDIPALSGRGEEAERALMGVWVCELAELSFMNRAEAEHVKSFLSRQDDPVRMPYGRRYRNIPRTVSFAATTNAAEFVRDSSGARRFWVFCVAQRIDIDKLLRDAAQLWAEAVAAYKAGEPWHLTDAHALRAAEASQWGRVVADAWDEAIAEKLIVPLLAEPGLCTWRRQAKEIWEMVKPAGADEAAFYREAGKLSAALERQGFEKSKSRGVTRWRIGDRLAGEINERRRQDNG